LLPALLSLPMGKRKKKGGEENVIPRFSRGGGERKREGEKTENPPRLLGGEKEGKGKEAEP